MKKILFPLLSTKSLVLGVTASIFLSSCSITNGAYTETDGIYYDPKTDVIPSNNYFENEDNRIDNIYNYEGQGLISNNKKNIIEAENRFRNTNNTQNKYSDWGGYAGSETIFITTTLDYTTLHLYGISRMVGVGIVRVFIPIGILV